MTWQALLLVLIAALLHATWNLASKRASGGLPFVWASGLVSVGVFAPLAGWVLWHEQEVWRWSTLGWLALSGVLHCGYSIFLQRAYKAGDFSLVYPLVRGTGPLVSVACAMLFLGERPSAVALGGAGILIASIFWLAGGVGMLREKKLGAGVAYGVGCGVWVAAYTVADRQAVVTAAIAPVLLDWGGNLARVVLFAPFVWKRRDEVRAQWEKFRREIWIVGVCGPLGYILVLWAMRLAPLSAVAPVREVSILVGAYLGARLLGEVDARRRAWATVGVLIGVLAVALG